jgi:hypothetical protein
MPKSARSIFQRFEFDPEEAVAAATLTEWNKMYIQNELAIAAETITTVEFNGVNDAEAARIVTYQRGKMEAFEWLLAMHSEAVAVAAAKAQEEAANQPQLPI